MEKDFGSPWKNRESFSMLPAYLDLVLSYSVYVSGTSVALLGGLFKG